MKDSIRLGQILGITLRVHYMVPVILGVLFLPIFEWGAAVALLYVLVLAPIVLLHELGHSLVARHFGVQVVDITFWPLGGMARMREIPEDARIEGLIAVAGPAVNFALAALAAPLLLVVGENALMLVVSFVTLNLFMGAFNLVPAFPMDGGRLLRAWLGRKDDWLAATERAVQVGKVLAITMILLTFLPGQMFFMSPLLPFIGLFVWSTGRQELAAVRVRHGQPAIRVGPFTFFLPAQPARGPRDAGGRAADPLSAPFGDPPPGRGPAPGPGPGMVARKPASDPSGAAHGWSEEDIERLERFPGRLRHFPPEL